MDVISVIVPVYNIQKYIKRCIDSIVNQTYTNLQIILIDDGSTDGSGKICDEMAMNDVRIEVFHKPNGGLADARNFGLEKVRGEYIAFVDGDDYIDFDMYECLYNKIVMNVADIASCGYYEVFEDKTYTRCCARETIVLDRIKAYEALFSRGAMFGCSSCNKLFRRSAFDGIKYRVGIQSEDLDLIYRLLNNVQSVVCIDSAKYHYVHRENSITTSPFSKRNMDGIDVSEKMVQFIHLHYPQTVKRAYAYQVMWLISGMKSLYQSDDKSKFLNEERYIKKIIKVNFRYYVKNPFIDLGEYIMIWAAFLNIYGPVQWLLDRCMQGWHKLRKVNS